VKIRVVVAVLPDTSSAVLLAWEGRDTAGPLGWVCFEGAAAAEAKVEAAGEAGALEMEVGSSNSGNDSSSNRSGSERRSSSSSGIVAAVNVAVGAIVAVAVGAGATVSMNE
jgi:hypothetical protein